MNPGAPNVKTNQIPKWWTPRDKRDKELFQNAKDELELFLKAMNQGVLLDEVYDIMNEVCPKGAIRFKEFGFLAFNDFLFHCDDLFDVRVDRQDRQYLFLRNDFNHKQQHLVKLVHGQRKDESDSLITRSNTRDVSTDVLVKRDMNSWISKQCAADSSLPVSKPTSVREIHRNSSSNNNNNNNSATSGSTVRKIRPRAGSSLISSDHLIPPVNSVSKNSLNATCTPQICFPPPPRPPSISSSSSSSSVGQKEFNPESETINDYNQEEAEETINPVTKTLQMVKQMEIKEGSQDFAKFNLSISSSSTTLLPINKKVKPKREIWKKEVQPEVPDITKVENNKEVLPVGGKEICTLKRAKLGSMKWIDCHFVGIDSFGYAIVKLSNSQLIEYFETEMKKLNSFYSVPSNQDEYRMRADELTKGRCVVIQTNIIKDGDEPTSFRFIRGKIFSCEQNYCVVLDVDNFVEHIVHHNNIYHIKQEFTRTSARAIQCILAGSENRMMYKDLAKALSLVKAKQNGIQINGLGEENCPVKVKVIGDLHPIYKCPIVEMKTMKEENVIQILKSTGHFFSFSSQNKSLTNAHLSSYQLEALKELENCGYFFDE